MYSPPDDYEPQSHEGLLLFDEEYYRTRCGEVPYERNDHWLHFFGSIADHIIRSLHPKRVFDAGCAMALLVEALWDRGVQTWGRDISSYALAHARPDMAAFCTQGSIADPIDGQYDLITCIEVLEHMPQADADSAIENMTAATDTILFSSTPTHFSEPTHVNVRPILYWLERFASRGFLPDVLFDGSFIAVHAILFRRCSGFAADEVLPLFNEMMRLKCALSEREQRIGRLEQDLSEASHRSHDYVEQIEELNNVLARYTAELATLKEALSALQQSERRNNNRTQELIRDAIKDLSLRHEKELTMLRDTQNRALAAAREEHIRELARHQEALTQALAEERETHEHAMDEERQAHVRAFAVAQEALAQYQHNISDYEHRLNALQRRVIQDRNNVGIRIGLLIDRAGHRLAPRGTWRWRLGLWIIDRAIRVKRRFTSTTTPEVISKPRLALTLKPTEESKGLPEEYDEWIRHSEVHPFNEEAGPLISVILPVYKIKFPVLKRTLDSLMSQTYRHWQACVAFVDDNDTTSQFLLNLKNDPRFRVKCLAQNGGISSNSNAAIALADGEYVVLLDHDDELSPSALSALARTLNERPYLDMVFTDKDSITEDSGVRFNPLFKPEWSPEMMFSANYLTHLTAIRTEVVKRIGGWRPETDGAQDWDLFLRVAAITDRIARCPGVHYHWRVIEGSTSTGVEAKPYVPQAQLLTIVDHVKRLGLPAEPTPHADGGFRINWLHSYTDKIDYIVIDDAEQNHRLDYVLRELTGMKGNIPTVCATRALNLKRPHNVSRAPTMWEAFTKYVNSSGRPYVAIVSSKVLTFSSECFNELCGWIDSVEAIRFSSAIILTDDDTVAEAGCVVDKQGRPSSLFQGTKLRSWGWFGGPLWYRNVRSVSPVAVVMERRSVRESLPILEANRDQPAFENMFPRLCLQLTSDDGRGLVVPYSRAYVSKDALRPNPPFDESLRSDPYFNPLFTNVSPFKL